MSLYAFCGEDAYVGVGPQDYKLEEHDLSPYLIWLWYVLDQTLRVATLDFMEVFYLSFSSVRHADTTFMCSLIFVYRLSVGLGLLTLVLRGVGTLYAASTHQVKLPENTGVQAMLDERHDQYLREKYRNDES